jgi:dipeptidyl aminopeptidase/acylaminoacyl peptidase
VASGRAGDVQPDVPRLGDSEGEAVVASTAAQVTRNVDPTPEVRSIKRQLVTYKRKDGVDLSFTLYLPLGYKEGTRVPAVLYAYPADYADPTQAGQVAGSQQTFTQFPRYRLLLLAGYAIIDNAGSVAQLLISCTMMS